MLINVRMLIYYTDIFFVWMVDHTENAYTSG